jgi:hypothetical protein
LLGTAAGHSTGLRPLHHQLKATARAPTLQHALPWYHQSARLTQVAFAGSGRICWPFAGLAWQDLDRIASNSCTVSAPRPHQTMWRSGALRRSSNPSDLVERRLDGSRFPFPRLGVCFSLGGRTIATLTDASVVSCVISLRRATRWQDGKRHLPCASAATLRPV